MQGYRLYRTEGHRNHLQPNGSKCTRRREKLPIRIWRSNTSAISDAFLQPCLSIDYRKKSESLPLHAQRFRIITRIKNIILLFYYLHNSNINSTFAPANTGVAQLVEHRSPKPGVGSSSLSSRAKKSCESLIYSFSF